VNKSIKNKNPLPGKAESVKKLPAFFYAPERGKELDYGSIPR